MVELVYILAAATILLPALGAVVCMGLRGRATDQAAILVSVLALLAGAGVVGQGVTGIVTPLHLESLPVLDRATSESAGCLFGLFVDPLSAIMLALVVGMGLLVMYYSTGYLTPRNREHPTTDGKSRYNAWMLLFIGSMAGVVLSPNFLQMFIFWELTTLCSWGLISYYNDEDSLRAGYKALILTHIGGLGFVIAVVVLFTYTASFEFDGIAKLAHGTATSPPHLGAAMAVFVLLAFAAWAKTSQLPFYTWLPDAMAAPTPVSAYLHAAAMVKAGVYLMARIVVANPELPGAAGSVVIVCGLATMAIAVFLLFFQDDLKRVLALSTISHLAYMLVALGLGLWGSQKALQGGILHIVAHACGKGLLFLTVGLLAYGTGTRSISQLSGVGRRLPVAATGYFIGAFTITGVPPLAGFWSKFLIITGAWELGGSGAVVAVLLLLESVIAFAFLLWVGQRVFLGVPSAAAAEPEGGRQGMAAVLLVLVVLCAVVAVPALSVTYWIASGV